MNTSRLQSNSLRYYLHDGSSALRFQLVGTLSRDSARDLEQTWHTVSSVLGERPVIIDISNLTGIDPSGQELLNLWNMRGARLGVGSHRMRERVQSLTGLPIAILRKATLATAWRPLRNLRGWILALLSQQIP